MKLLTAALQAYVAYTNLKLRRYIDDLEDEIDKLASVGDADSVLRIERLSKELNASSYDPPVITLTDGRLYTFQEVSMIGRGQKYYSQYVWQRALITGQK